MKIKRILKISLSGPNNFNYNFQNTVIITGTGKVSQDSQGNELDSVSVSGSVDLIPPTLTFVSPAAGSLTNGLVTVQAKATDNSGVYNVEFLLNGQDIGAGVSTNSSNWTMNLALAPGTNLVQAVATDIANNNSPTNSLKLVYVNKQTNANVIAFSEHWLDAIETDNYGDTNLVSQDAGLMNVAQKVSGLSSLSPDTWSNLVLSLTFGDINFSSSLSAASVLTSSNAVFYEANNNPINIYIARSGDVLTVTLQTVNYVNPSFMPSAIIADFYLGSGGGIAGSRAIHLDASGWEHIRPIRQYCRNHFHQRRRTPPITTVLVTS